jgi:hypothetical protein
MNFRFISGPCMERVGKASILAALGLGSVVAACSPGPVIDALPASLGLPANAPARPTAPYQYPAVHDIPPARSTTPISEEQQYKLEKELTALRDRQEALEETDKKTSGATKKTSGATKKASEATKKKPAAPNTSQSTGAAGGP